MKNEAAWLANTMYSEVVVREVAEDAAGVVELRPWSDHTWVIRYTSKKTNLIKEEGWCFGGYEYRVARKMSGEINRIIRARIR